MKVLHCINSPKIGGLERLVINLATEQKRTGLNVSILLDNINGDYYKELLAFDIPVFVSNLKGGYDFNLNKFRRLQKIFKQFDIIHLHSFSVVKSIAANHSKSVYTIHGLSKGVRIENKLKQYFREAIKSFFLNRVDAFVANSNYTLEMAIAHYKLSRVFKRVVFNGVPLPKQNSYEKNNDQEFFIGLVSRFTKRKRIERLVNAFDLFIKKGGQGKLMLIGDGTEFNIIKRQVLSLGLNDKVIMPGYQTDVSAYYKKFSICVHPSDNEGFGLVGVEAYLHGKPIIAFKDSGGLKEVIAPLEPENIIANEEELAERILFYFNHKDTIKNNVEKRMLYVRNSFSIERMAVDYKKIYSEVIG